MPKVKTYNEDSIFLVEDNVADVIMIKEAFKQLQVTNPVRVANNGADALSFLEKCKDLPGLIILDLNLPKVGGHEVLEQLKSDKQLRHIPVVIFTTSQSREDITRSYQLHANCYLTKPMDFDSFTDVISALKDFWLGMVTLPEVP